MKLNPHEILVLILAITGVTYLFDQFLDYLNLKAFRSELPPEVADFYDREKYTRSLEYHRESARFGFLASAFSFLISAGMLWFGGFGALDWFARTIFTNEIPVTLLFFAILMVGSDLLSLPFQWYSTFVIEAKYGFNKTTVKTFITDKLKGYLLGAVVGGVLVSALIYLIQYIGPAFWIWFSLIASLFVLLINMFYTSLIVPLFNKLTPLENGPLREQIQVFSQKVDFPLDNIFVIDGSRRSSKANAFFSGIGRKKRIVLYDTLINNHTTEELVAVLAHEVGHYKKKHIIQGLVLSIIQIVFTLFILSRMVFSEDLSLALGGTALSIGLNLVAFGILFSPVSGITGLLMNVISRKNEFEADAYAGTTYNAAALSNALKKLSVDNLSNLYPHPLYVFFHYSHPPLLTRLKALHNFS